jgi:2-oxoacid:acceptor oxidoreductase gamma subunit (pyruvate/2-ketoisovalerate family)
LREIRMLSRGGQGAVTAAKILVSAAIMEGKYGQAVPSFGQERKGAPVYAFARLDDEPVSMHTYVYDPHAVVLFDLFLLKLGVDPCAGLREDAILVANTHLGPRELGFAASFATVACIDAWRVTNEVIGAVPPNAAMLGALSRATGWVGVDSLCDALNEFMPGEKGKKNAACARAAYERTVVYVP